MSTIQLTLAARYLAGRKLRTSLTTLAILLAVMLTFGMTTMIPTMVTALRQNMMSAAAAVDVTISHQTGGAFSETVAERVRDVEGVAAVSGILRTPAILPPGLPVNSVVVYGVDPESITNIRLFPLIEGRFLEEGDTDAMVIPQRLAEAMDLAVGDTFSLPSAEGSAGYEVIGIIDALDLPGADGVYVTLESAQAHFNQIGLINEIEASYAAGVDRQAVGDAIAERLGSRYQLGEADALQSLQSYLTMAETIVGLFGWAAMVMGAFIIFITFRTIVYERRRDIGMLRAVGASRATVIWTILTESIVQGIIGSVAGLIAGYAFIVFIISQLLPVFEDFLRIETLVPPFSVPRALVASAVGLGMTVAGGVLPALSASRVTPLDALRPLVGEVAERAVGRSGLIGIILLVLALLGMLSGNAGLSALGFAVFIVGLIMAAPAIVWPIARIFGGLLNLIFAREGQLAQGNVTRQPGRAAITATTMMIGLAVLVALAGMISSLFDAFLGYLDRSLGADFLMMPASLVLGSGNVAAGPALAEDIAGTDGIAAVTTLRIAPSLYGDVGVTVIGIDSQTYAEVSGLQFREGDPETAFAALADGRAVIVNGIFASQNRVGVGDTLTFTTAEGEQDYRVVAIGTDYLNSKFGAVFISQANMEADFHQTNDVLLLANMEAGADAAAVRAALEEIAVDYPAFSLFSREELRLSQEQAIDGATGLFMLLLTALAVPSLIALLNTLTISVIERTREIGMIRAVGATQRQVRRIILAESLLLAAIGTALGLLGGVWLSWLMVEGLNLAGFILEYSFPAQGILVGVAVGLLFGVIAAVIPARQAAKIEIVQALRYE